MLIKTEIEIKDDEIKRLMEIYEATKKEAIIMILQQGNHVYNEFKIKKLKGV